MYDLRSAALRGREIDRIIRSRAARVGVTMEEALQDAKISRTSYVRHRDESGFRMEDFRALNKVLHFPDEDLLEIMRIGIGVK